MITPTQHANLIALISSGKTDSFYDWPAWKAVAAEVRRLDNNECQACKAKGRYRRGKLVHHVKPLREHPGLALSIYDPDTNSRQLVTLCRDCHAEEHPEYMRQYTPKAPPLTVERWD